MSNSVKSYAGLDPERCESSFRLPDELCALLEELQTAPVPEWVETPNDHIEGLMSSRQQAMVTKAFGKYTPKGYEQARDKAYGELEELAAERGYPVTGEDRLASHVSIIERIKALEEWKGEQKKVRAGRVREAFYPVIGKDESGKDITERRYLPTEKVSTEKVNGKWQDAVVYELPPFKQNLTSKASFHEDSQYAIRLGDTVVDLMRIQFREGGKLQNETEVRPANVPLELFVKAQKAAHPSREYFLPVMRDQPDRALQSIAARMGVSMRGGAHSILQALTGKDDIVPSYMTVWRKNRWLTIVSWQKDAKLAKSSYGLVDGRMQPCSGDDAMTVSEFDYSLFTDFSDLEIQDGEEIRYDYEDDESYMVGMNRDKEPEGIDLTKFAEDDDEMELLKFLIFTNELDVINLSNLDGKSAKEALIGEEVEPGKWSGGIKGCRQTIKSLEFLLLTAQGDEAINLTRSLEWQKEVNLPRFQRMLATRENLQLMHTNGIVDYWMAPGQKLDKSRPSIPEVIPGSGSVGCGEIQVHEPIITEVDSITPAQTLFRPTLELLRKGIVGVCRLSDGTYATKYTKSARIPYVTAKNANPALKLTLSRLMVAG